jgi:hypothetical protein
MTKRKNKLEKQEDINREFDKIQEDLNELERKIKLKSP